MKHDPWVPLRCSYTDSKKINAVSDGAEILYLRLIAQCDDNCNFDGNPTLILCKLYAERAKNGQVSKRKIEKRIAELTKIELIRHYDNGGESYIHLINCLKCARKDCKKDVRFPVCDSVNADLPDAPRNETVTDTERKRNGRVTKTPRQNRTEQNRIEQNRTEHTPIPPALDTPEFKQAWNIWVKYRGEIKSKLAPTTIEQQLKKLSKHTATEAIAMLEQSMAQGWRGLFEVKDDNPKQQKPKHDRAFDEHSNVGETVQV